MRPNGSWTTTVKVDVERRGRSLPPEQLELVERLRQQAFSMQRRFEQAEQTANLLKYALDRDSGLSAAIDGTYEANAFSHLRYQLFRILVLDLGAVVLDADNRTGSVRSMLKELRRDPAPLAALKAYYADPLSLDVTIEGDDLDEGFLEQERQSSLERSVRESSQAIDDQWARIDDGSGCLKDLSAQRVMWARNKAIAHAERHDDGIFALWDDPPYEGGKLRWSEPIEFLSALRPYVYHVYGLLTSTYWGDDNARISEFYARAFWDRVKNGSTDMRP
jgi:hypothetical protein